MRKMMSVTRYYISVTINVIKMYRNNSLLHFFLFPSLLIFKISLVILQTKDNIKETGIKKEGRFCQKKTKLSFTLNLGYYMDG